VKKFGVYEVTLHGDGAVDNPFDTVVTVTFTPASGQANAKTVYTFYDGGTVEGGGRRDLASPWQGTDVVLRLRR
jgi:hypothetical protein